jgi:hypothetical protein
MAVACIRIESDIGNEADIRNLLLDGASSAADEIVGIQRFCSIRVASVWIGIRKERDSGDAERGRLGDFLYREVDAHALDARHGFDRFAFVLTVDQKDRPDEIIHGECIFSHEAARPIAFPVTA